MLVSEGFLYILYFDCSVVGGGGGRILGCRARLRRGWGVGVSQTTIAPNRDQLLGDEVPLGRFGRSNALHFTTFTIHRNKC